ncbi:methyl-accepting chemotaxis protein [Trinickia terrae]|uniref:Methyl-accepting chemotaxis protein n=1 Tax=Trinickia terrae TaxID=2571161 RepID=A0A4U1I198_9BURK|nr:methyl-accepting chemotaxis protein [Trinickia terrae]TKC86929.1 methyl-accepting chemotaxis protein [Trinickia terrae]
MNLVKQSLYLCIGVLLGLIGLQGIQSLWQTHSLAAATEEIVRSNAMSANAEKLWVSFLDTEATFRQAIAFTDPDQEDSKVRAFNQQAEQLRQAARLLQDGSAGAASGVADATTSKVEAWLALAARFVRNEPATELPSYHLLDAAHDDLKKQLGELLAQSAERADAAVATSRTLAQRAQWWTAAEMAFAVALGVSLGWLALRSLYRQLGADAAEVARVANAVASGDLSVRIDAARVPGGSVMAATARMQQSLIDTVTNVRAISAGLANGTDDIAVGNGDLSIRTEQQAAAIVRTAATMEELDTAVRHSADQATQASKLAGLASDVAAQGGSVVGDAVQTMRGINESSRRIVDIIGVIDGIAFQTNILALNAAVEAARAGENGRGFAVVAGEVRVLAQRSASAAKEIKELITSSVSRVEEGSSLIERAGHTMDEVQQSIRRVTDVMEQIRQGNVEQSGKMGHVGQEIGQLDTATQQNSALAVETARAAESLREQGHRLVEAVSVFRLPVQA